MQRLIQTVTLLFIYIFSAGAQQLEVDLHDMDFRSLPRVTFTVCVSKGDTLVPPLDASNFVLTENGVPHPITIRCPVPGKTNSVMLVFDNSGSIQNVLGKLIEAGGILVDSLSVNDEAAVMTFNHENTVRQDFTNDKNALKTALGGMTANGGTALWDASLASLQLLGARQGKRYGVILTDGDDRNSTLQTVDPIIRYADSIQARLFTIAFGIPGSDAAKNMRRIADETGGIFFDVQRPSELTEVYKEIASVITEQCCIGEYFSNSCEDSLRNIRLSVTANGETGFDEMSVFTPFRPLDTRLRVEVPEELTPQQSGTGYIYMDPPPHPDLELTMTFTLRYNNDLIDITPALPLSLGTATQNQLVTMTKTGPNEMQFTLDRIKPALNTGRLVGFPVQPLRDDSVSIVEFSFDDSIYFEGCPTNFALVSDTTIVCPCFEPLDLDLAGLDIAYPDRSIEYAVFIPGGLDPGVKARLQCEVRLPDGFELLSISNGELFDVSEIQWQTGSDGWISVSVPDFVKPAGVSGVLLVLEALPPRLLNAGTRELDFRNTMLWNTCCPDEIDLEHNSVLIDGICGKIVRRRPAATVAVTPNPVRGQGSQNAQIRVEFNSAHEGGRYRLSLVNMYGEEVRVITEQQFNSGAYTFPLDSSQLPSGTYKAVLMNGRERVSDTMILLR